MADASNQEGSAASQPDSGQNTSPPIRTMKDDLAAPAPPSMVAGSPSSTPKQPLDISPQTKASNTTAPPTAAASPPTPKKKKRAGLIVAITLVFILAGAAAGAWYYFYGQQGTTNQPVATASPSAQVLSALEVIPSKASIIVHYDLSNNTNRQRLTKAWEAAITTTPINSLLSGNPNEILNKTDISEFAYVVLESDPRPYLILQKTPSTEQIVAQQTEEQVLEKNGWYIVHPLSYASYSTALQEGSLANSIGASTFNNAFPLHLVMSKEFLQGAHENIEMAYPALTTTGDFLVTNGEVNSDGNITLVTNDNILTSITNNNLNKDKINLSKYIPEDAIFTWQGSNLSQDIDTLVNERGLKIDRRILEQVAVDNFLKTLTNSYAYYQRQGSDSISDIGLVITIPETLLSGDQAISIGDKNLEAALQSIIPRITGQPAVSTLAFNDTIYKEAPLKFVNLIGTTQALDYALYQDKILIATSKEGMTKLIDTVTGQALSMEQSAAWSSLLAEAARLPVSRIQVATTISESIFSKLFPAQKEEIQLIAQSSFAESAEDTQLEAAIGWGKISTPSPTPSPSVVTATTTPTPGASVSPQATLEPSQEALSSSTPTPSISTSPTPTASSFISF